MNIDLKLAQILSSRLCHDLVGVSSGIKAGLDLLQEEKEVSGDYFDLAKKSAEQVAGRLSFFRVAFGLADGQKGQLTISEIKNLCDNFVNREKVRVNWLDRLKVDNGDTLKSLTAKVLLNLILIGEKCLTRGGEIRVQLSDVENMDGIAVEVLGENLTFSESYQQALSSSCTLEDINPQNVNVYITQKLAKIGNGELMVERNEDNKSMQFVVIFKL